MQEVGRDTGSADRRSLTHQVRTHAPQQGLLVKFQLAAVRLAAAGSPEHSAWGLDSPGGPFAPVHEMAAARALVELAESGEEDVLRALLRPDPTCATTSWTVACYRVGDLVPCALRDFTAATEAVRTLLDCGEHEHLAAELVASTPEGLCWAALVRTGDQLRFQLFGTRSILERPGRHGLADDERAAADAAQARWAALLASWYTSQGIAGPFLGARLVETRPSSEPLVQAQSTASPSGAISMCDPVEAAGTSLFAPGTEVSPSAHPSSMGMLFDIALNLRELSSAVSAIAQAVDRLERAVGGREDARVDCKAPEQVREPVREQVREQVPEQVPEPVREQVRRWRPSRRRQDQEPFDPGESVGGAQ